MEFFERKLSESAHLRASIGELEIQRINELAINIIKIFENGHKIAFVGNGGSAAEAIHFAAEFVGKCLIDHKPLPAICLNESQSILTAVANDYGVEKMFLRTSQAYLTKGDLLIAMSTSGRSMNIMELIKNSTSREIKTYFWTGLNADSINGVQVWRANSTITPRIQEIHLMWGHLLSELVEEILITNVN